MKVYISGRMTGVPENNAPAFRAAEKRLKAMGHDPACPLDNGMPETASWEQHMRADIIMLMTCDAVALLPDWEDSKGSRGERAVAELVGIKVLEPGDWMGQWSPSSTEP